MKNSSALRLCGNRRARPRGDRRRRRSRSRRRTPALPSGDAQHHTAMRRISSSAPSLDRSSSIVRHARAFPVTTILVSVEFGKHAARRFARHLPPVHLVGHPAVPLHQLRDERDVRRLCAFDLSAPGTLEQLVAGDGRRHDEACVALVDVALRELRVGEPRAMADELVRQRAAHALEEERVVRVLQDTAVSLLLDVLEVIARRAVSRDCAGSCSRAVPRTPRAAHRRCSRPAIAPARCSGVLKDGRASTVTLGS